jgi:hypothetical protein
MAIKTKSLSLLEDFSHEVNLKFTKSTGWFIRFKNRQQFHNIKFIGESAGSDALDAEHFPGVVENK